MSEWITDRLPTMEHDGIMVYGSDGAIHHWAYIDNGEPWKPIPKCEPYMKPDAQPDAQADYTDYLRAEVERLKRANDVLRKVNQSMDTLLNRLQEAGVIS